MTHTPTPPCLGEREAVARTGAMTAEEIAEATAADPFCQPAPPSIPVRGRYYLTECEHCGWVGSSEQCRPDDEDVICPACLLSICGDGPDEADTAKHGEAVYQRIVTAAAQLVTLREQLAATEARALRAEKTVSEHAEYIIDLEHLSYIRADLTWRDQATRLNAALSEERARVAVMRTALEPFAKEADRYADQGPPLRVHHCDDTGFTSNDIYIGDLRRARAALTLTEAPHDD